MQKNILYNNQGNAVVIMIIVLTFIIGGFFWYQSAQTSKEADNMMKDDAMMQDDKMMDDEMMEEDNMMKDDSMTQELGSYVTYSADTYNQASDKKRVLFFHAKWCPTCIAANLSFNNNLDKIPADVVLLKTDYDTETALKEKYGITYQHTFVQVDAEGNEIAKWNGGDIDELVKNVK